MTRQTKLRTTFVQARRILHGWLDSGREMRDIVREAIRGDEGPGLPPLWLRDVGPSDFEATGSEFLRHFTEIGGLRPSDSVLEIGCGPGRMALPLTRYLSREGGYVGMDVVRKAISWCQRNISRSHPNFRFYHVDITNARYNPTGTLQADDYVFPFEEDSFDFVFLTSVFTHMYPAHTRHYLHEIGRLLRPSGRLFCTFFLLNSVQRTLQEQGRNQITFQHDQGTYRIHDELVPEGAIAVDEQTVHAMMRTAGLTVREPIWYGTWSGRGEGLSFQDVLLAERVSALSAASS